MSDVEATGRRGDPAKDSDGVLVLRTMGLPRCPRLRRLAWVLCLAIAGFGLAGEAACFLTFATFVASIWIPLAFHVMRLLPKDVGATSLRVAMAACLAVVCTALLYVIRKPFGGYPIAFDVIVGVGLLLSVVPWRKAFSRYVRVVAALPTIQVAAVVAFVICVSQSGFAFVNGDTIGFTGLHVVDFGNLTSVTALVKISEWLPVGSIAGNPALRYHWLYFSFPAWASQFLGSDFPADRMLSLTNSIVAWAAVMTIYASARAYRTNRMRPLPALLICAIVILAPFSTYLADFSMRMIGIEFRTVPPRNHLILSPINSLTVFGNNTLACAFALLSVVMARKLSPGKHIVLHGLTSLLVALTLLFSITLFLSLSLGLAAWYLSTRGIPKGMVGVALVIPVVLVILLAMQLGMLSSDGQGRSLALQFDKGQWCLTLMTGCLPIFVLVATTLRWESWRQPEWMVLASCVLVPSFIYVAGSKTGGADMSMKTGTMISLLVVSAWVTVFEQPRCRLEAKRLCVMALVCVGVVQSAAYLSQFPLARLGYLTSRVQTMPKGKYECLRFVQVNSNHDDVVLDRSEASFQTANEVTFIAERVSALESPFELRMRSVVGSGTRSVEADPGVSSTPLESGYRKGADRADIILAIESEVLAGYERVATFGEFSVWRP